MDWAEPSIAQLSHTKNLYSPNKQFCGWAIPMKRNFNIKLLPLAMNINDSKLWQTLQILIKNIIPKLSLKNEKRKNFFCQIS